MNFPWNHPVIGVRPILGNLHILIIENPDLRHIESPQYHLQVTDCSGNKTGETEEIEEDIDELIDIEQDEQECTNKNNKKEDPVDHSAILGHQ